MILQIMSDIKYFLVVLAIALTGFALAFWLISYPQYDLTFGTIPQAFLNTYQYMLGQGINADFTGTASPELGVMLLVMFMLFMMIVMLNLLIALMGDSFATIKSRGVAHWRREQACIILEQYSMVTQKTREKFHTDSHIHILRHFVVPHDAELSTQQLLLKMMGNLDGKSGDKAIQELKSEFQALELKVDNILGLLNDLKKNQKSDSSESGTGFAEMQSVSDKRKSVMPRENR